MNLGNDVLMVLMIVRSNCYTSPGGDTVQVEMTAKYLRKLGLTVDILLSDAIINYDNYNIVHFFNVIRPDDILPHINNTKPFVVSTIFVDYSEYEKENRKGLIGILLRTIKPGTIEYLKAVARWIKNGDKIKSKRYLLQGHDSAIRYVLSRASILLPNSNSEYRRLNKYIPNDTPYKKVVNAVDPQTFNKSVSCNEKYNNHVLCVGRIEGRKNQLSLIKAFVGTAINITIIGKASPNHIEYYNECKKVAIGSDNIHFIEHISHDELVSVYRAAKVHVLPSWFETTGLSSLEAAVMECNIVITDKGDTREYFQDMAYYCEPDNIESIKKAVMDAYSAPVNPKLKDYILEHYTWEQTAKQTLEAYQEALKKQPEN